MTISFDPYTFQKKISVQEVYGDWPKNSKNPNLSVPVPEGYKAIAFRPPKAGESYIDLYYFEVQTTTVDLGEYSPRIIVEVALSEIEKAYGINATVESLWTHYCGTPSDYGKPTFDYVPEKTGVGYIAPLAWVGPEPFWVPHGYFWNRGPKCVWAYKLTDVEKVYGQGATIEDLWKQYCPTPECYGKPRFGEIPKGIGHVGVVWQGSLGKYFTGYYQIQTTIKAPRLYAPYLNVWQKLYGESITDAEALEKLLRDRKELQADQELEPELRRPLVSEVFVSPLTILTVEDLGITGPRAIVRKKVQQYLKIPLERVNRVWVESSIKETDQVYRRLSDGTQIVSNNAQIVEE